MSFWRKYPISTLVLTSPYLIEDQKKMGNLDTRNDDITASRDNGTAVQEEGSDITMPPAAPIAPQTLVQTLWRRRWLVLFATILVPMAAFVYLMKATPIYTGTSRIYVEQSSPRIITETEEGFMTRSYNYLYTQAELLRSAPILSAVLEVPGVGQMKTFAEADDRIACLEKNLEVSVGKKDDIISVSFDSPFPAEAAQIANAVVDCYITYHATHKRSTAAEVLRILQSEEAKRREELSEKLKALMDFKRRHVALAFESENGNTMRRQLESLSTAMTNAQLATIRAKSEYDFAEAMVKDPAGPKQFLDSQQARGVYVSTTSQRDFLESALGELRRRRADRLRQVVTGNHPSVKALDTEIAQMEKQLADLYVTFGRAQLAVAQRQYLAAQNEEMLIAKQLEDQRQQASDLNEKLTQYTLLQSEWEQTKKLCDILDDRINELHVTEDVGALNISVLEVARPATVRSEPQNARVMGSALVLGFMLGAGLALLRDWTDPRLRSTDEVSAILGVPILGVVPSIRRRRGIADIGQTVHLDSGSDAAEAYRAVRTAVFFGAPKQKAKTVLVTSPLPGDGKTTLVSNLGIGMAQVGLRILILDADLRKPMQHNIFEIDQNGMDVSNVLMGTSTLEETVQRTKIEGLQVLCCRPGVPNPSELLNSEKLAKTLGQLSAQYDRIIVDSPPVMSVTDAQILAAVCDVTLLVLSAKANRKISQQARNGLLRVGACILGTVVNDVRSRNGRYHR